MPDTPTDKTALAALAEVLEWDYLGGRDVVPFLDAVGRAVAEVAPGTLPREAARLWNHLMLMLARPRRTPKEAWDTLYTYHRDANGLDPDDENEGFGSYQWSEGFVIDSAALDVRRVAEAGLGAPAVSARVPLVELCGDDEASFRGTPLLREMRPGTRRKAVFMLGIYLKAGDRFTTDGALDYLAANAGMPEGHWPRIRKALARRFPNLIETNPRVGSRLSPRTAWR
jgi:hypothetical protein